MSVSFNMFALFEAKAKAGEVFARNLEDQKVQALADRCHELLETNIKEWSPSVKNPFLSYIISYCHDDFPPYVAKDIFLQRVGAALGKREPGIFFTVSIDCSQSPVIRITLYRKKINT